MRKSVAVIATLLVAAGVVVVVIAVRGGFSSPQPAPPGKKIPEKPKKPLKPYEMRPDRDRIKTIADEKTDYRKRMESIRTLSTRLRKKLVLDAINILRDPKVHETVRNDLLTKLEQQEKPCGLLGPELARQWKDPKQTAKWRNYVLQHMAPVWKIEPANRGELQMTLLDAATEEKGVNAETAMISLQQIGEEDKEIAGKVRILAKKALAERAKDMEKAVAAMHILSSAGDKSILPDARKLAADKKVHSRLRMAAMAVLGSMGEAKDEKLLSELAAKTLSRLKTAAELNLKAIRKRLGITK